MHNINPDEAFEMLKQEEHTLLVDVRTRDEWEEAVPYIEDKDKFLTISIYEGKNRIFNESFLDDFTLLCQDKNIKIFFICKSGARSSEAASLVSMCGYTNCFNIAGGFEGWKSANLPYKTGI